MHKFLLFFVSLSLYAGEFHEPPSLFYLCSKALVSDVFKYLDTESPQTQIQSWLATKKLTVDSPVAENMASALSEDVPPIKKTNKEYNFSELVDPIFIYYHHNYFQGGTRVLSAGDERIRNYKFPSFLAEIDENHDWSGDFFIFDENRNYIVSIINIMHFINRHSSKEGCVVNIYHKDNKDLIYALEIPSIFCKKITWTSNNKLVLATEKLSTKKKKNIIIDMRQILTVFHLMQCIKNAHNNNNAIEEENNA